MNGPVGKLVNYEVEFGEFSKESSPTTEESSDSIEDAMDTPLSEMDERQLFHYFLESFKRTLGYEYATTTRRVKEIAILRGFRARYGPDAGPIIQFLFQELGGRWKDEVASITMLSEGAKWIQDGIRAQLWERRDRERETREDRFMGVDEFFKYF